MSSRRAARFGATVGVAALAAVLAAAPPAAAEPSTRPETAFALAGKGILNFGPLVKVGSPDGEPVHAELVGLSSVELLVDARFSAGLFGSDARAGYASTSVASPRLSALVSADLIRTTCENGRGKVEIVNGSVLGNPIPQFPISGQSLGLGPLARITLGEEKRNADGSITVTGIKVGVLPGGVPGRPGAPGLPGLPGLLGLGGVSAPPVAVPVEPAAVVTDEDEDEDAGDESTEPSDAADTPDGTDVESADAPAPSSSRAAKPRPRTAAPATPDVAAPAVPGLPNLLAPLPVAGRPLQTITIGSATCGTVDGARPDRGGPGWGADHDGGGVHDWSTDDDEPSADAADDAPAPEIVEAHLPVTG